MPDSSPRSGVFEEKPMKARSGSSMEVMRADAGEHLRALQRFDLQGEHVDTAALLLQGSGNDQRCIRRNNALRSFVKIGALSGNHRRADDSPM